MTTLFHCENILKTLLKRSISIYTVYNCIYRDLYTQSLFQFAFIRQFNRGSAYALTTHSFASLMTR